MNKTELIAAVAEQRLSKKDAEKAVSSTIDTIINTVAEGERFRSQVSAHLNSVREMQEQVVTQEQVNQSKFLLQRFPNLWRHGFKDGKQVIFVYISQW